MVQSVFEEKCKKAGKSVFWLYAPDYAKDGKVNVKNISEITGINVSESKNLNGGIAYEGRVHSYDVAAPYFSIDDENAKTLAIFENGAVAAAYKEDKCKVFYVATCNLPSGLLREIAKLSGVCIYSENDKVYTYVNSGSMGVYNALGKDCVVNTLKDGTYKDLITGESYESKNKKLILPQREINAFLFEV